MSAPEYQDLLELVAQTGIWNGSATDPHQFVLSPFTYEISEGRLNTLNEFSRNLHACMHTVTRAVAIGENQSLGAGTVFGDFAKATKAGTPYNLPTLYPNRIPFLCKVDMVEDEDGSLRAVEIDATNPRSWGYSILGRQLAQAIKPEAKLRPGVAPLGYMNRAFNGIKDIIPDPDRAPLVTEMFNRAALGWSGRRLQTWLQSEGFTNRSGAKVSLSQIFLMLNNTFYYGEFEYPEASGVTYHGAHQPLITKEIFEQVQATRSIPNKAAWGSKQFAFKDIFKCGTCGASITAEEKYKPLKDGGFNRHVYYHCTKKVNPNCPEKYINEKVLIEQLIRFISENAKSIEVTSEINRKMTRHTQIANTTLQDRNIVADNIDPLAEYSRFILMHGSYNEQTQLIEGINSRFVIRNSQILTD